MTKEELKKEANHYALNIKLYEGYIEKTKRAISYESYLAGAEPREREIESLGKRCLQLQKDKGNLTDSVRDLEEKLANADYQLEGRDLEIKELEAQIEKMKCCGNCKNFNNFQEHCELDATQSVECHCNNYKLWEIKE